MGLTPVKEREQEAGGEADLQCKQKAPADPERSSEVN